MLRQFHLVILIHSSDLFIFIFLHTVLCVRIFVIIFFPLTYPCSLCYVKWSCVCLSNSVSSFFISFHLVTYIHTSSRCYIHLFVGVLLSYIYFFTNVSMFSLLNDWEFVFTILSRHFYPFIWLYYLQTWLCGYFF